MSLLREKTNYFTGEFIGLADLKQEQACLQNAYRTHISDLHTWGIAADGLSVIQSDGKLVVEPGFAVDSRGNEILLENPVQIEAPADAGSYYLTIEYTEHRSHWSEVEKGFTRITAVPEISLQPLPPGDPSVQLILAQVAVSAPHQFGVLDFSARRVVSIRLSRLSFHLPGLTESERPFIRSWQRELDAGLLVRAPLTALTGDLLVANELGVGTTVPEANLDVLGTDDIEGTGRLSSSEGTSLIGQDTLFLTELHIGDQIIAIDGTGNVHRTEVSEIRTNELLITKTPIEVSVEHPFYFRQAYLASFHNSDASAPAALSITQSGNIGINTDSPEAKLHVGAGDVYLDTGSEVVFRGNGELGLVDLRQRILFRSQDQVLDVQSDEDIQFSTGADLASLENRMVLSSSDKVGIGTDQPAQKLSVNGIIASTVGYMFPDETVQTVAAVSVPVGTVIDWWVAEQAFTSIPDSFQICDGSPVANRLSPLSSIPDLRGRFVKGAQTCLSSGKPIMEGSFEHTHEIDIQPHKHPIPHAHTGMSDSTGNCDNSWKMAREAWPNNQSTASKSHTHAYDASFGTPSVADSQSYTTPTQYTESHSSFPKFIWLIKIIRII